MYAFNRISLYRFNNIYADIVLAMKYIYFQRFTEVVDSRIDGLIDKNG